jgi:hypothetical protein
MDEGARELCRVTMRTMLMVIAGLAASVAGSGCAAKAAPSINVTVCGSSVAIPDVLPPPGSGPVVLMAAPCLIQDDGTPVIPPAYRRHIELQVSRPLDGVWVPYDASTLKSMQDDYRRLWNTGRLSDLTFSTTDHTFPNGVIGKLITYTLKER